MSTVDMLLDKHKIDKDLIPIIKLLWFNNIETYYSCSGHLELNDYEGYIYLPYKERYFNLFFNLLKEIDEALKKEYPVDNNDGNRSLYHPRMVIEIDRRTVDDDLSKDCLTIRFKFTPYSILSLQEFYKLVFIKLSELIYSKNYIDDHLIKNISEYNKLMDYHSQYFITFKRDFSNPHHKSIVKYMKQLYRDVHTTFLYRKSSLNLNDNELEKFNSILDSLNKVTKISDNLD